MRKSSASLLLSVSNQYTCFLGAHVFNVQPIVGGKFQTQGKRNHTAQIEKDNSPLEFFARIKHILKISGLVPAKKSAPLQFQF